MSAKNYVTGNEMIVLFFFLFIRNDSTILIFIADDIKVKSLNFIIFLSANRHIAIMCKCLNKRNQQQYISLSRSMSITYITHPNK